MNRMRIVFVAFLATISARWLLAGSVASAPCGWLAPPATPMAYAGLSGIGTMSVALLLATRPVAFAPWPCIALTCPRAAARPASRRHVSAKACRISKP